MEIKMTVLMEKLINRMDQDDQKDWTGGITLPLPPGPSATV